MKSVLSILWDYRFIIMVLVALGLFTMFEWQKFKALAYSAMLKAKSLAKDAVLKSGAQQEEWVVKKLLQLLPRTWVIFISEDRLRKLVHWLYHKGKDYIDDGKLNGSI